MHPRHLTGLPGNFFAGAGLALYLAARRFTSFFLALLFSAHAFAASNVIQYTYDPVGNITNIARQSTGGLAITSFTPTSAPVGTAVTIYGAGFSATPANNTVTFNGTAATVTASDAGSIATTVPAGATTGRISVQVGASTVYSAQDFVVTIAGAPTIASFTPTIGAAGTSVSVTGTNFNATSGATTFFLNGVAASGGASSTTAATFTVPASASSGRVSATTSVGTGTSTSDFIVPPPGLSASDIESVIRIAANGGNSNIAVGTANKSGLVLFNGTASTYYSLQFKTLETTPINNSVAYQVIKPDSSVLVSGSIAISASPSLHLPSLPATGTYTLVLSPGIATLNTMVRLEANPVLALDGAAAATTQDYNNQSSRFVFSATAGQRVGIGLMGLSFFPSGVAVTPSYNKPDGSSFTLTSSSCDAAIAANTAANCDNEFVADQTGTYTVKVPSGPTFYSSASIQLNSTASGTLTADSTQSISLTRVGQDAAYSFTGSVGDSVGIDFTATSLSPQTSSVVIAIEKPDGSTLTTCTGTPPAGIYCEAGTLATAGTYTATVDPLYGNYGSIKLTLKQGPVLTTTDPPSSFSTATASESARARFTATAGQNLNVGVGGLTYPVGGSGNSTLIVYRPDRSQAGTATCNPTISGGNCGIALSNLAAGTYGVVLRPATGVKVSGTFALSNDVTGTLTAGTAQTVTTTRAGQRASYTFAGTAGDNVAVEIYGLTTTPATETVYLTLYGPTGTNLGSTSLWRGGAFVNKASLPSTGTYSVVLEPNNGVPFTAQLLLDAGTSVTIDGSTATLATTYAGQPLRYRFSGTAAQALDFGVFGLGYTVSSSNTTGFTIYKPDGTSLASGSCTPSSTGSCDYSTTNLPSTGTYVVMFSPPFASIVNAGTLAVSTPVSGTFVVGNPAQSVSIARAGQTARYTFSGTSGQTLKITYSSVSIAGGGSLAVTVLNPSGGTLTSASVANGGNSFFNLASLPTTGTYTVVFDPPSGTTMSGSFSLVTQ
jgi:hypothetical protein